MSASKDTIAQVFERHVERFGYQKTTLDEVASEMHISKKTIYNFFDGKADIYGYIVQRQAEREKIRMRAAVSGCATYGEKLEMLVRSVIGLARAHILETEEAEWMQEYEIAGEAFRVANGDLMREFVAAGMATGEMVPGDERLVERTVAAAVVEYVLMVREDPGYNRDDEFVERIMRFVG